MLSASDFSGIVHEYFEKQNEFKKAQTNFTEAKAKFNSQAHDFFQKNNIDKSMTFDVGLNESFLTVTKIQNIKVEFNPDKLEKAIGKEFSRSVIEKHYEITDMSGLISYLKGCGVDPAIFKSFISVHKSVNTKELDRLEELGKISAEQVKGCYTIKNQSPYFTVRAGKGRDND